MTSTELTLWRHAETAAQAGQHALARSLYQRLTAQAAWQVPAQLRLSMSWQQEGQLRLAVQALKSAAHGELDEDGLALAVLEQCFALGEVERGLAAAASPVLNESREPRVLLAAAQALCDQSFGEQALPLLERAAGLGERSLRLFYLVGVARQFTGDLEGADAAYQQVLRADPNHVLAYSMRVGLRRQKDRAMVEAMLAAADRIGPAHAAAPILQYALFKALDDLGDADAAWGHLSAGMKQRRAQLAYSDLADQQLFDALMAWRPEPMAASGAELQGPSPVFVVGLPRSGTTLLERMLGGHPDVCDAGELRDLTCQARVLCDQPGGGEPDRRLVEVMQRLAPWSELGREYLAHTQWRAQGRSFYTDKLPTNHLLVGWICQALPQAKVIHMVRDPLEVCFSNLKLLFAPGNAHSFDQQEMAAHCVRQRRLMRHWHELFPGRVLDVSYETLVQEPESVARRVLGFCGLPWTPDVLKIEARTSAVATASMVQVREGIQQRYLGQVRRYEHQLQPLKQALQAGGLI